MRGRYYDASIGRFISRDPAGLPGGVNMYAYAGDDPVDFSDPTGQEYGFTPDPGQNYYGGYEGSFGYWAGTGGGIGAGGGFAYQALALLANQGGLDITQGRQTNGGIEPYVEYVRFIKPLPYVPDPSDPDALGPEWVRPRGPLQFYYNPKNKQSLSPDPKHGPPIGSHWDLYQRGEKSKLRIRRYDNFIQFWEEDINEWLPEYLLPEF